ncbi:thioredoxin domain-containing protein [Simkania negevensis]|uniref:Thioredoxin-like fold domain-containing protein n=1 Tax=Simkania negevensis (strain ATCC VR-1471 / DSM 27360 / Z) TaxID=331113 RepID=F8L2Y9_SIMNZ|nr:thioredoxin domain-containing protein [Simkania negevensis]CCB87835.1 putative uncharacterized protein [Simkania negevensis Z]
MLPISHRTVFYLSILVIGAISSKLLGFEKLDAKYTTSFGDPSALVQITEYFSFGCEKCLRLINQDFPQIKKELVDTGKVYWVFHPDPADLLTLQLMICLEKLTPEEKKEFFSLAAQMASKSPKRAVKWMGKTLRDRGCGGEEDLSLSWIEKASATQAAMRYLKQEDAPIMLPTIEVNGQLKEEFPTVSFIKSLINPQVSPCNSKS